MARGKHSSLAANRRYESAVEHIDRLNDELVEAKMRARTAEARAQRLEGVEKLLETALPKNDEMLQDALKKLSYWKRTADADRERRHEAFHELYTRLIPDLTGDLMMTSHDKRQFLIRRYPAIIDALSAGSLSRTDPDQHERPTVSKFSPYRYAEKRMSDDELKRFQKLTGQRAIMEMDPDADAGRLLADLLEARQVGFTTDEILEYVGGES